MKELVGILLVAGSALAAGPHLLLGLIKRAAPEALFAVKTTKPVIALSIDDGPSEATGEILEVLRQNDARATFFVIGEHVRVWPEQIDSLRAAGELAHHMMKDEASLSLSEQEFRARFVEMDSLLQTIGGTRLFRPGSGLYNAGIAHLADRFGYRIVLGSVYPFDAQLPSTGWAEWYIREHARPGSILILHDGAERGRRTAQVLRRVLPELKRRGFQVVTVSDLLKAGAPETGPAGKR